jgi:hypothetical protein
MGVVFVMIQSLLQAGFGNLNLNRVVGKQRTKFGVVTTSKDGRGPCHQPSQSVSMESKPRFNFAIVKICQPGMGS